jgi:hypothetical protein
MSLIIFVLAVFFVIMLITPTINVKQKNKNLEDLKMEVNKYSGLDPGTYYSFLNNIELMETQIKNGYVDSAVDYLHKAIENIQELSLYLTGSTSENTNSIINLSRKVGIESEKIIMDVALIKRIKFKPIYLNELE